MKTEKLKLEPQKFNKSTALRNLKPGEMIRCTTAADYYGQNSRMASIGKQRNVKFGIRLEGDDVLIYIKP